ncbi:MAG: EamA family transporter [Actinomycetota bacterium]|nr:EamA family transporter [Actinomycetota bacterium]
MLDAPLPFPGATQHDRRAGLGYVMALAAAVLFAVNGTVSKIALTGSELTAVDYTQLRTTGAFLGLALGLLVVARDKLRFSRRDLPFMAFYGVFSFALVQWLYFVAIERLPIGIALLIQFSGVVLVALWARLVWHVEVRPRVWAALALTLVGLALVSEFWLGWTLDTLGVVACVGAAITLATYLLAGERAVEQRDPLGVLCLSLFFASLLWAVVQRWTFPTGELNAETSLQGNLDHLSAPIWVFALWTILLGTIAPFGLSIAALRHLAATRLGITLTLEPVVATFVAWAWLDETLATPQLIGGAVVLTGILLAQTAR